MSDSHPTPLPSASRITTLYALGSNGNYQLGLPHNEDINVSQKCVFNITQPQPLITTTTISPDPFTSPPSIPQAQTQTHIPLHPNESISTLAAGGNHTHILTTHGRVYAAGSNTHNELGLSPPSLSFSPSTNSTTSQPPVDPTPGFHHLTWTGPTSTTTPNSHHITHLASTFTATILVSSYTTLFTVGHGPKGELGLSDKVVHAAVPTRAFDIREVEGEDAVTETVVGCVDHVLVLSGRGVVYGFGSGRRGKLGGGVVREGDGGGVEEGREGGIWWSVRRTDMDRMVGRVRQVAVGREFSVVAGESGELAVFGRGFEKERKTGFYGNAGAGIEVMGRGRIEDQSRDQHQKDAENDNIDIDGSAVADTEFNFNPKLSTNTTQSNHAVIHAGWSSLTLHHPSGQSTGFLSSTTPIHLRDRGQLPPSTLPHVTHLAVGSEHTVALLEDGSVVAWGWGEHGNCGEVVDGRGVVGGGRWNVLWRSMREGERGREKVVGIGAGCGTSFFWMERGVEGGGVEA